MDNSDGNKNSGSNNNGDGSGDRSYFDGILRNHLARLRLSHIPSPLYASPPTFVTAQAAPVENFFLSTRERQFICRWLDEIALPEDCEPAIPEDGAVAPAREPEDDQLDATEEFEAEEEPGDEDPRAQEIRRLLMSFHLQAQQQDLDDVASLVFDPPVPSPRPLALSPNRRLPGATSAPEPAQEEPEDEPEDESEDEQEDEPEHDGTFFFYPDN